MTEIHIKTNLTDFAKQIAKDAFMGACTKYLDSDCAECWARAEKDFDEVWGKVWKHHTGKKCAG